MIMLQRRRPLREQEKSDMAQSQWIDQVMDQGGGSGFMQK
jgi:hypothetical protein